LKDATQNEFYCTILLHIARATSSPPLNGLHSPLVLAPPTTWHHLWSGYGKRSWTETSFGGDRENTTPSLFV